MASKFHWKLHCGLFLYENESSADVTSNLGAADIPTVGSLRNTERTEDNARLEASQTHTSTHNAPFGCCCYVGRSSPGCFIC
ncbi:hypothetical protein Trydic_g15209 [Trypoxylus dichotomus]